MNTYIKPTTPYDSSTEWSRAFSLLDLARRLKKSIRIYRHDTIRLDQYRVFQVEKKPITLKSWTEYGQLIYFKATEYDWISISFDDIDKIEILD